MSFFEDPSEPRSDYVYVPVPVDRVDEVYRLLAGDTLGPSPLVPAMGLDQVVEIVYRESDERFRALLFYLAEHAEEWVSSERLATVLELPSPSSLSGMLGAYGRRAKNRYAGFWPFERRTDALTDRTVLMMDHKTAEAIERASSS